MFYSALRCKQWSEHVLEVGVGIQLTTEINWNGYHLVKNIYPGCCSRGNNTQFSNAWAKKKTKKKKKKNKKKKKMCVSSFFPDPKHVCDNTEMKQL